VTERALRPPPPADLNAWAEAHIKFGRESPVPGPYRRDTIPPSVRILKVLGPEHTARTISIKASAQFFKTTVGAIFIGGSMDLDPCDMGYVHPTHDNAVRWSRRKWKQMRKGSVALSRLFGEGRSRAATDTILYQETRDGRGSLQISGASSEASLSMVSWPKQVQDDLAKWETNEAGDPERQADNRSAAFDWAKILKLGTPLFAKTCRITRAFKAGTQERFHVPCPHCEHHQPLEWSNFLANIDREHPEKAHFTCVACGCEIEHKHKLDIIARGLANSASQDGWVADNPAAKDPSFHIWRAYSRFRDWESIAREWIAAEGDPNAEQTFYNDVLGLEYERASEAPPWKDLQLRADGVDLEGRPVEGATTYERGTVPIGALLVCLGVDCQGDRTEVHVKGFGPNLRRWTIDYRVVPHHIATIEGRDALDALLKETWPDVHGNRRGVDMLAIDGNAWTNDVFGWARERRHPWTRVIIVRGARSDHAPPLALTRTEKRPDGKTKRAQKRFYNVGVSGLKSSLYEHLKKPSPLARGFCGYPRGLTDDFFIQLTAESREVVVDRWGFPYARWRKNNDRNEVLDTEVYAEAAAIRCGWYVRTPEQWDALRMQREKPRQAVDQAPAGPAAAAELASQAAAAQAAHQATPRATETQVVPPTPRRGRRTLSRGIG
jgi:phage terminase large subunit GpA-like protein